MKDIEQLKKHWEKGLPALLGMTMTHTDENSVKAEMEVTPAHLAPNGYLHAGSVVIKQPEVCKLLV